MKVGVFGGSFDPIHVGHLRFALEALEQLGLDEVILEVARMSPFKQNVALSDAELRYAMVERSIAGVVGLRAGRVSFSSDDVSYMVDTLRVYSDMGYDLTLLMGADVYGSFDEWHDVEGILRLCDLGVGSRSGYDVVMDDRDGQVRFFSVPNFAVSSTDIRRRVSLGLSIHYLVPDVLVQMIESERLYK